VDVNDITYGIRGAIFEVNRVLGPGFLEKVFENALLIELRSRGYTAESQVPIKVYYKEDVVGEYIRKRICDNRRESAVKYTPNVRTYARRA